MLRYLIIFHALCVIYAACMTIVEPGPQFPPTKGEVWPKANQEAKTDTYYKISPSVFKFTEIGATCDIVKSAISRYTEVIKNTHHIARHHSRTLRQHVTNRTTVPDPRYMGALEELQINLSTPCDNGYPDLDMDEHYALNITSTTRQLSSASVWGILRGLETFVHLIYMSDDYQDVLINSTQIIDFPKYKHRGLLIDTSRHYLSMSTILKTLDGMEMNKMNVLHWHIVDDQSFPYVSEVFPHLSAKGAFDPTMVYTKTDINQVLNYARDRGIRVLPEFDVPGHTRSWGVAYPTILTKCYRSGKVIGLGPMDPTNNATYKLIRDLFLEVQDRFPDKYFHVGGDEVDMDCWISNPELLEFMSLHNMSSPADLHTYFMTNVIPLLGQKSTPIVWQEVFDEGVPLNSDAIVQVWKHIEAHEMIRILQAGHKLLYSASWYLDQVGSGGDWQKFYKGDPREMVKHSRNTMLSFLRQDEQDLNLDNVLGGEACMWGESVDDRNMISRVWPRASAVAEVLWSGGPPQYSYFGGPSHYVVKRLEEHACRMNRRGVHAQPPNGPGFCVVGA